MKNIKIFGLSLIFTFCLGLDTGWCQSQKNYPPELESSSTEIYKTVGETKLRLWIYKPEGTVSEQPRSAIVFFFGGGWRGGTPQQFHQHCRYLAKQGMVAITADYRVLSRHQTLADRCVADAKSAIRYVRQNAKRLGIDPHRIVAAGGSAGGHLAACTDLIKTLDEPNEDQSVSSRPNAVAMFNPALILAPWEGIDLDEEKLKDIEKRTGVPAKEISPIHHLRQGSAPSIIFHGQSDTTVPYLTAKTFAEATQRLGNECELIGYAGEPHGFFNYGRGGIPGHAYLKTLSQLHQFLNKINFLAEGPRGVTPANHNVKLREAMIHSHAAIADAKAATVAFIGGSITEMNGYRPMVCDWLKKTYPETEFNFVNAGISSTCSTTGAFRLQRDVLSSKPDLVLIEFAVNDDQDAGHSRAACIRGMEGIIRHAKNQNPQADLVVTYFVNPPMLQTWQAGKTPLSVAAHETVLKHYGVSSVILAKEVSERITNQTFTWKEYGGTHPAAAGNRIAADLVKDLLSTAWSLPESLAVEPMELMRNSLPRPIDDKCYQHGQLTAVAAATHDANWAVATPNWKSIPGSMRPRFEKVEILSSSEIGAEVQLQFRGTAMGLFVLAGPDAGQVEFQIDDGPVATKDLYHRHSRGLHYPRTVMLDDQLQPGPHSLTLRVGQRADREDAGSAIRIMSFATNAAE